jgi:hypothetical protein
MQETQHAVAHQITAHQQPRRATGKPFVKGDPRSNKEGRKKGQHNVLTRSLKEAVEIAARDCHPQGLAGWLVDRANGGVQDRAIFATMVAKVIPIQVNQSVQGGISISLNWLAGRNIGTKTAQAEIVDAQVVDAIEHSPPSHWTNNAQPDAQGIAGATSHAEDVRLPSPSQPDSDAPAGR